MGGKARARPRRPSTKAARASMASMSKAMLDFQAWACRRSTTATTSARWPRRGRRKRLRLPGLRAGLYPPAVLPRHRPVPLGSALGRSRGHLQDRRQGEGADCRTTSICTTGSTWRASASSSRACRRASAGSASAIATASASPSTRWWQGRAEGAGRDRPRPSRLRLGRLAEPRDGSDEGRLGCRLRLAAAERAAQHRIRRHLGVAASRRRRRHGLLAAFRHGHRADGTPEAAKRLERVLWNDPAPA
jgi:hypothetical protein